MCLLKTIIISQTKFYTSIKYNYLSSQAIMYKYFRKTFADMKIQIIFEAG